MAAESCTALAFPRKSVTCGSSLAYSGLSIGLADHQKDGLMNLLSLGVRVSPATCTGTTMTQWMMIQVPANRSSLQLLPYVTNAKYISSTSPWNLGNEILQTLRSPVRDGKVSFVHPGLFDRKHGARLKASYFAVCAGANIVAATNFQHPSLLKIYGAIFSPSLRSSLQTDRTHQRDRSQRMALNNIDPDELGMLYHLGDWLQENFAPMPLVICIYGVHITFFSVSTSMFLRRKNKSSSAWFMFIITILGLLLATANLAAQIADYIVLIRVYFVKYPQLPVDAQEKLGDMEQATTSIIGQWTSDLMPIVSDIVVIWRCWVLFPDRRWVMALPLTLLTASVAMIFAFLGMVATPSGYDSVIFDNGESHQMNMIYDAGIALSLATNATATSLIAWKLWAYRKFIIKNVGPKGRSSPAQNVLVILVESGVVFCCLQLTYLILDIVPQVQVPEAGYIIDNIFYAAYTTLSAMYPTVVVVLVDTQRSIAEMCGVASEKTVQGDREDKVTTGHLSFVVPQSGSTSNGVSSNISDVSSSVDDREKNGRNEDDALEP
ncbi:hypothetical protein LshimejAT787_0309080 [Lyophyllum shimeji]|uniref:Uncharacterized protein n=1 Tax=Lyophyllum shimeji TaxID=47721 RepID=A0A9P3PIK4_LYOSH|nr:hypothetical protein LshimejAT787_0309080 [Lyophyllum shimeji]